MADHLSMLRAALSGRYEVGEELGRGGMGTVYLARDVKHDRPVAIKTLRPELASAIATARFLKEIQFTTRLTHPHILPIFDSGEADGTLYYVTPFVEGESLRSHLSRSGRLPVAEAVRIARDVAEALDYAHRRDVLHRDIKPENILLEAGQAVVADFGIARAISAAGGEETLTTTGQVVGTPLYMSPEQVSESGGIDGRSDIYSLGCVLYEMLTGKAPHAAPTPQAVLARVLTEPVPLVRTVRPDVPIAVERVVATAVAKDRVERFATAGEFAAALEGGRPLARRGHRLRRPLAAALVALSALGGLFVWHRLHGDDAAPATKRVAVLPFENLGDSADAYFADGMTEAVRGKLSAVDGLQITARSSSNQYRGTTKTPRVIGQELGVQYLLTGTIRWLRNRDGTSRVQVTPELVRVVSASTQWEEPFDTPYTDVFVVQAEIAGRVAQALDVALSVHARQQLDERPTSSLAAYDAYLRGEEASQGLGTGDITILRRAAGYYAQAVALDPTFVQAWDRLSRAHSGIYSMVPTPQDAEQAREGAEHALALAPERAEGRFSLALYYSNVANDNARAANEYRRALQVAPNNADLLSLAGRVESDLGRWDSAISFHRRAQILDPRAVLPPWHLTQAFVWLRRPQEAREAAKRTIGLAPREDGPYEYQAMTFLADGDLPGARSVISSAMMQIDSTRVVAAFARYWDLYWALDETQQRRLLRLTPAAFDDDVASWGLALAETYWLRGDRTHARAYADSARLAYEERLRGTPEDGETHSLLGLAHAYLGHTAEAIREGKRGESLEPIADNGVNGPYYRLVLTRIYLLVDHPEEALDALEPLLRVPFYITSRWLRVDPTFDPLRQNPRFQRLVAGN